MKYRNLLTSGIFATGLIFGLNVHAVETGSEKAEIQGDKATNSAKETYRNAKNEICELVNGKMHCAARKMKDKTRTAADKTKTKAKEIKNKVD